jgi:nitroimidazol reductase NimA-like FMN-containing flavoprotein (pyridoxamine 5'-phosphate oxidase superfamily)
MRRTDREITDIHSIKEIIEEAKVLRIAFKDDLFPYIVPVNFGYEWTEDNLPICYVHGAKVGKKLRLLEKNHYVAIELDEFIGYIGEGDETSTQYASIIGRGIAEIVENPEEKQHALQLLMKHVADMADFVATDNQREQVGIIKIQVQQLTGKQNG